VPYGTKRNLRNPHFSSIDELNVAEIYVDGMFRLLKINIFDAKQIAPASAMLLINLARLTTVKYCKIYLFTFVKTSYESSVFYFTIRTPYTIYKVTGAYSANI